MSNYMNAAPSIRQIIPFQFNRENAAENGRKSWESRKQQFLADKPPEPNAVQAAINAQLTLVDEQIKRTRKTLNDDDYAYCEHCERAGMPPHHKAQLLKALDTLLDRQRNLLGVSFPSPHKGPKQGDKRTREPLAPMPVQIAPIVPQAPPAVAESTPPVVVSAPPANLANDTRPQGVDF